VTSSNAVTQGLDAFASQHGFTKHSRSWYRQTADVLKVLNLQKSQYGPSYYLNVALWLPELGDTRYPPENHCHVRTRLNSIFPDDSDTIDALLNLEAPVPDRVTAMRAFLTTRLAPLLDAASSTDGLRHSHLGRHLIAASLVTGDALSVLAG
jgi:hypothetical protein